MARMAETSGPCWPRSCPDSDVRIVLRHSRCELRNRRTLTLIDLAWLWFRSPHVGLAARMMRTSNRQTRLARGQGPVQARRRGDSGTAGRSAFIAVRARSGVNNTGCTPVVSKIAFAIAHEGSPSTARRRQRVMKRLSFAPDIGCLNNRPPFVDLGLVEFAERLRGLLIARENRLTEIGELRADGRIGQGIHDRRIELGAGV